MVRDPHSREFDKKPLKSFIVNQTTLLLERGQLRIPHRDMDETLARQMTNYQVVRFSAKTGEATYTDTDEHALDGLMFGLLAFINEKPDIAATVEQKPGASRIAQVKQTYNDPFQQKTKSTDAKESELRKQTKQPAFRARKREALGWGSRGRNTRMPSRGGW